jgi:hypothetical protein
MAANDGERKAARPSASPAASASISPSMRATRSTSASRATAFSSRAIDQAPARPRPAGFQSRECPSWPLRIAMRITTTPPPEAKPGRCAVSMGLGPPSRRRAHPRSDTPRPRRCLEILLRSLEVFSCRIRLRQRPKTVLLAADQKPSNSPLSPICVALLTSEVFHWPPRALKSLWETPLKALAKT